MTARQIIAKIKECGWLVLTNDNCVHVGLPAYREDLLEELKANKEQVRAILLKRQNAKRKRKAPAFGPEPAQAVSSWRVAAAVNIRIRTCTKRRRRSRTPSRWPATRSSNICGNR